jgi:hypothetical protein
MAQQPEFKGGWYAAGRHLAFLDYDANLPST